MALTIRPSSEYASLIASSATSHSFPTPLTPVTGKLQVMFISGDKNDGGMSTWASANGWNLREVVGTSVSLHMLWRESVPSETTLVPAWASALTAGGCIHYFELEETDTGITGPWDWVDDATAYSDTTTNSRATPTVNPGGDAYAIAAFANDSRQSVTGWDTGTESITFANGSELFRSDFGSGSNGASSLYSSVQGVAATDPVDETFTYVGTADQTSGLIGAFWRTSDTPPIENDTPGTKGQFDADLTFAGWF